MTAYSMALNVNEYAIALAENHQDSFGPGRLRIEVPTYFAEQSDEVVGPRSASWRRTYRPVRHIWNSLDVPDAKAAKYWDAWLAVCNKRLFKAMVGSA
jgi:hypothetical protein